VIEASGVALRADTRYDVIAVGRVSTIEPLILTDDGVREDANSVRLRVAHLSPLAQTAAGGAVDVFVMAPDVVDLSAVEPTVSFSFKESAGPIEVPAGDYRIRVTPAGADTVVYDSGTVPLPAGADLLVGAIDNTVAGTSPISLLVINGADTTEILDTDTQAGIRAAHTASGVSVNNVDVYLNTEPNGAPAFQNLAFGDIAPGNGVDYVTIPEQDYRLAVTAAGTTTPIVIDTTLALALGDVVTVVAAGSADNGTIEALTFQDDNRRIATAAKLRLIHGAIEAGNVDVYLIPAAESGATVIGNMAGSPTISSFEYSTTTGYLQVAAGSYVAFITEQGNPANVLYESPVLTLATGNVYTAVARLATDGERLANPAQVAGLTLLGDFN
jgi:hypothetical protein